MRGGKVHYDEMRPKGVADDGRQIDMEGDEVVYREMTGVESIEEQVVEAQAVMADVQAVVTDVQAVETDVQAVETDVQAVKTEAQRPLPEVLTTEQAMVYWRRLMAAGFVDENCQLLPNTSRRQACDIVDMFAQRMGAEPVKWKLFEDFWGKKNLAQDWSRLQTARLVKGKEWKPRRYDDIAAVFEQPV